MYDLGGGTFDITLLDLSGQVFEVLATAGDTSLGGDDVDVLIAERMSAQFREIHRFDPLSVPEAFGKLRLIAEKLKIQLSVEQEVSMNLAEIAYGDGGAPLSLRFRMNRKELEHLTKPLIDKTVAVTRAAIEGAALKREMFERVVLVGGSTRMPLVARRVEEFFGKPPFIKVNPDEVVALGAAIQAFSLDRNSRKKTTTTTQVQAAPAPPPAQKAPPPMRAPMRTIPGLNEDKPGKPLGPAPVKAMLIDRGEDPSLSFKVPDPPDLRDASISVAVRTMPMGNAPPLPNKRAASGGPGQAPPPPGKPPAAATPLELPREEKSLDFTLPLPGAPRRVPSIPETAIVPELPIEPIRTQPSPTREPAPAPTSVPASARPMESARPVEAARPSGRADLGDDGIATRSAPLLIDVTPLSLSVETVGGWCDILIPANSPVPCDRSRIFLTAADGQTLVCVNVAQGDSRRFGENTFLGQLELAGLEARPRGETRIRVTFEIDADGILNVRAQDMATGRETQAKMRLLGGSTGEDVQAMVARQREHEVN